MAVYWKHPFHELDALRQEFGRILDELGARQWSYPFSKTSFLPGLSARAYPLVNISEDQDNVYVHALAPGVNPDELEISVVGDTLRLAGKKEALPSGIKPEAVPRNERNAGRFVRSITLPVEVDNSKVTAEYSKGILSIVLPKVEEAKPKQVAIKVS